MDLISPKFSILIFLLFGPIGLKAQNGRNLFDDSYLHKIEFNGVDTTLFIDEKDKGIYQKVNVEIDGTRILDIGIATKGEKSFLAAPNNKKPFKIKVNKFIKGQKYDGIKRFNLHNNVYDNSIMREKFSFDAAFALGVASPRVGFAEVYINGLFWGVYTLVEAQDEVYRRVFGNNDGMTMEAFGSKARLKNLEYQGDKEEDYHGHYIVDKGEEELIWPEFIKMLNVLKNTPNQDYVDTISKYYDPEGFFKFNAVLDYNNNMEHKNKNAIHYQDSISKKWNTICWDQNVSFPELSANNRPFPSFRDDYFITKYEDFPEFRAIYNQALCDLRFNIFNKNAVVEKIKANRSVIDDAIKKDPRIEFTFEEYELSLQALENYVVSRNSDVDLFLEDINLSCGTGIGNYFASPGVRAYPNPSNNRINLLGIDNGIDLIVTNVSGSIVLKTKFDNSSIDISNLLPGVYFIRVENNNQQVKFVKVW